MKNRASLAIEPRTQNNLVKENKKYYMTYVRCIFWRK